MIKSIVVAMSINHVIGNQGNLPWHMPADMNHFKKLTMGHHVIMGRKTFESIPHRLPGRVMVVLSTQLNYQAKGAIVLPNLEDALRLAASANEEEVFIAGGATIYQEAILWIDKIYLTVIEAKMGGDTFFPVLNPADWKVKSNIYHPADIKHEYGCNFITLERCK